MEIRLAREADMASMVALLRAEEMRVEDVLGEQSRYWVAVTTRCGV